MSRLCEDADQFTSSSRGLLMLLLFQCAILMRWKTGLRAQHPLSSLNFP